MTRLYVLGRFSNEQNAAEWELQGVFTTPDDALPAAHKNDFFIMPVPADQVLPTETVMKDVWFPLRQPLPDGFF